MNLLNLKQTLAKGLDLNENILNECKIFIFMAKTRVNQNKDHLNREIMKPNKIELPINNRERGSDYGANGASRFMILKEQLWYGLALRFRERTYQRNSFTYEVNV